MAVRGLLVLPLNLMILGYCFRFAVGLLVFMVWVTGYGLGGSVFRRFYGFLFSISGGTTVILCCSGFTSCETANSF